MVVTKSMDTVRAIEDDKIICPRWYFEEYLDDNKDMEIKIVSGIKGISGCNGCPYKDMFGSEHEVTGDADGREHSDTVLTVECNYLKSLDPAQKQAFYTFFSSMHGKAMYERVSRRAIAKAEASESS